MSDEMQNVDELFSKDLVDSVAAETDDVRYDELGNPIDADSPVFAGQGDDDLIELDELADLDELILDSFDGLDADMFVNVDAGDVSGSADAGGVIEGAGDHRLSGIEDDEETPDAGAALPPPVLGKKKDRRTARSQAYAKKKADKVPAMDAGIGDADVMEASVGDDDLVDPMTPAVTSAASTSAPGASSRQGAEEPLEETETVLVAPGQDPLTNAKRKGRRRNAASEAARAEDARPSISVETEDEIVLESGGTGRRAKAKAKASAGAYDDLPDDDDALDAGALDASDADQDVDDFDGLDVVDGEYDQVDLPDWADSIRRKVNANVAHAFLLNGNVRDYMVRNIPIKDGIVAALDPEYENFDIIAEYDLAHGISFYGFDIQVMGSSASPSSSKKQAETARTLADAYRDKFIEEMRLSQERLSIPVTETIPNRDPVMLFTILSDMFEQPSESRQAKILLFIDYSDLLVPDASSAQMKPEERKLAITLADMGRSQFADECGNVMIFITDDMTQLSTRIRSAESRIEQVKISIPDRDERMDFIENVLDVPENTLSDGTQVFEHEDSITKEAFAINAAGLSRMQIEDIMLRALSEDEPLTMQLMKERKQEIIREDYDDVLEIIDPKTGFERVGGMEFLKQTFQEEIIDPIHAGEYEAVPKGVLLSGAPGVAKTLFSKAVAKEAGMNFVALNLNRIMEKWVGSTERNLDRALDCALAMAPTIIFIDEIDEALPNRADPNASSVNKRINQRLLTFFSEPDHRGKIIILAATNYPEKIDPAFKRAGRFDLRVPIFAPDDFDRMRIIRVIAQGRGYSFSWFEDPDKVVDNPFKKLEEWIHNGNTVDTNDKMTFFGRMGTYSYTTVNEQGKEEQYDIHIPNKLIGIIGKDKITLQQLYESARMIFTDLPRRTADAASGLTDTDEAYSQAILDFLYTREDVLGANKKNIEKLHKRLWLWEKVYSTFVDQTFRMTGAELDVVMNKAINLFKKWRRKVGAEGVQQAIAAGAMTNEKDIPWQFLYEACTKTVNAVAGIKQMEDMALINTSDTDFIPDALYIETDDGRMISYLERHEELSTAQTKSTLG